MDLILAPKLPCHIVDRTLEVHIANLRTVLDMAGDESHSARSQAIGPGTEAKLLGLETVEPVLGLVGAMYVINGLIDVQDYRIPETWSLVGGH